MSQWTRDVGSKKCFYRSGKVNNFNLYKYLKLIILNAYWSFLIFVPSFNGHLQSILAYQLPIFFFHFLFLESISIPIYNILLNSISCFESFFHHVLQFSFAWCILRLLSLLILASNQILTVNVLTSVCYTMISFS